MTPSELLETILPSFEQYYAIKREDVAPPFDAEAYFSAKDIQTAVFRSVKISEAESGEYIFFACVPSLSADDAKRLDEAAWAEGISRVQPGPTHRNTDICLFLIAETVEPDAFDYIKKLRRHKSYKHMFEGWSNYRAIVVESSSGHTATNRLGRGLEKLFDNIGFIV